MEPCDDEPLRGVEMSFGFGSVSVGAGLPPRLAYGTAYLAQVVAYRVYCLNCGVSRGRGHNRGSRANAFAVGFCARCWPGRSDVTSM